MYTSYSILIYQYTIIVLQICVLIPGAHIRAHEGIAFTDIHVDTRYRRLAPFPAHFALRPSEARPLADVQVVLRNVPLLRSANELGRAIIIENFIAFAFFAATPCSFCRSCSCLSFAYDAPPAAPCWSAARNGSRVCACPRVSALARRRERAFRRALVAAAQAALSWAHWAVARRVEVVGAHPSPFRCWL